ncbi:MAG: YkgJ family cysteine cluster protein [Sulfurospirillum sp.]|nr:YkgJ family cysteine cluster protein [Sulfurospirillum sp.]
MEQLLSKVGYDFSFNPRACESCEGNCCIGESGYIWVSKEEIAKLAQHKEMEVKDFMSKYLIKVGYRYSITEMPFKSGFRCVFFDVTKRQCSVYEYRPIQCRTFPFWEHFKDNIKEVKKECPGIS